MELCWTDGQLCLHCVFHFVMFQWQPDTHAEIFPWFDVAFKRIFQTEPSLIIKNVTSKLLMLMTTDNAVEEFLVCFSRKTSWHTVTCARVFSLRNKRLLSSFVAVFLWLDKIHTLVKSARTVVYLAARWPLLDGQFIGSESYHTVAVTSSASKKWPNSFESSQQEMSGNKHVMNGGRTKRICLFTNTKLGFCGD